MSTPVTADDFEIGKTVFEQLNKLSPDRQTRILRWVAESLNISPTIPVNTPTGTAQTSGGISNNSTSPGTSTDIKTFITAKSPKSDTQFAATVAYYYQFEAPPERRKTTISADVLQEATRLARRDRLMNPAKTLNNAKIAGYLDGAAQGEYSINSVGENLVAMTLPGGSTGAPLRKPAKRTTKTKQKKS